MLVVKERKTLLLNLRDPGQVMTLIPEAKKGPIKGKEIVAVPHTHDVVRVLRNVGITAPSPMEFYYDWPCHTGKFPNGPFIHQRETAAFAGLHPRAYILNGMGSGKTVSVLWAFDYLRKAGLVDWLFVISPLSTLERAWGDEIFTHFPDMSFGVLHGDRAKRMKLLQHDFDAYIINHDGIKNKELLAAIRAKPGRGLFVVDELAEFSNATTDKWKALNWLINGHKRKRNGVVEVVVPPVEWAWGLTGTPIPNAPTDAWAQCRLITPWTVPDYFGKFRDNVMRKITPYKWWPRDDALPEVYRVMQPAIRFSREDCIDLPPTTSVRRDVELTAEQKKLYKDMMARLKAEYLGGQLTAANAAVKHGKLLQIVLGVAYGKNGEEIVIPSGPRMQELLTVISESASKTIVFVPLTAALDQLAAEIGKHYSVCVVQGSTPKTQRDRIFHEFQNLKDPQVMVANPGCMAHGLSFTAASTTVWYAPHDSPRIYTQANERTPRPGQKLQTLIVHLQGSPFEKAVYDKLERKEGAQNVLLDMFGQD
jgi:SNF2 family DNA or RNA helicase